MPTKRGSGIIPLYIRRPRLVEQMRLVARDPKMNRQKMAKKLRISVDTVDKYNDRFEIEFASSPEERKRQALMEVGAAYSLTEEKIQELVKLAANPRNNIGDICRLGGVSRFIFRNLRKETPIKLAVRERQEQDFRIKKAKMRFAVEDPAMNLQKLRKLLGFSSNRSLRRFARRARVKISHLPALPPQPPPKMCKRCKGKQVRAKGYCRSCWVWARNHGLVGRRKR